MSLYDNLKSVAMGAAVALGIFIAWLHDMWLGLWYGDKRKG